MCENGRGISLKLVGLFFVLNIIFENLEVGLRENGLGNFSKISQSIVMNLFDHGASSEIKGEYDIYYLNQKLSDVRFSICIDGKFEYF